MKYKYLKNFVLYGINIVGPVRHTHMHQALHYNSQTASSVEAQASPFHLAPFARS